MATSTLLLPVAGEQDLASWAAVAFVASYSSPGTRQAYTTRRRLWFGWCEQHHLEPLADVHRPHVELYVRDLEARGLAPATIALTEPVKLVVLTGFYRYCIEEQLLEHSRAVHMRRPKVSQESTRLGLDRTRPDRARREDPRRRQYARTNRMNGGQLRFVTRWLLLPPPVPIAVDGCRSKAPDHTHPTKTAIPSRPQAHKEPHPCRPPT